MYILKKMLANLDLQFGAAGPSINVSSNGDDVRLLTSGREKRVLLSVHEGAYLATCNRSIMLSFRVTVAGTGYWAVVGNCHPKHAGAGYIPF